MQWSKWCLEGSAGVSRDMESVCTVCVCMCVNPIMNTGLKGNLWVKRCQHPLPGPKVFFDHICIMHIWFSTNRDLFKWMEYVNHLISLVLLTEIQQMTDKFPFICPTVLCCGAFWKYVIAGYRCICTGSYDTKRRMFLVDHGFPILTTSDSDRVSGHRKYVDVWNNNTKLLFVSREH